MSLHCISGLEVSHPRPQIIHIPPYNVQVELAGYTALRPSPLEKHAKTVSEPTECHPIPTSYHSYLYRLYFTADVFTPTPFRHDPNPIPT